MKKITTVLLGVASVCCLSAGALMAKTPVNVASAEETSTASVVLSETKYKVSDNGKKMILVTAIQNFDYVYEVGYEFSAGYSVGEGALTETTKYYDSITTHTKQTAADIFGEEYDDAKLVIWEVAYAEGIYFNAYAKEGVMVNDKLTIPEEEKVVRSAKRDTFGDVYTVPFSMFSIDSTYNHGSIEPNADGSIHMVQDASGGYYGLQIAGDNWTALKAIAEEQGYTKIVLFISEGSPMRAYDINGADKLQMDYANDLNKRHVNNIADYADLDAVTVLLMNTYWEYGAQEVTLTVTLEKPALEPVEFTPGYDANWSAVGDEDGAKYYQSFQPATIFARYVEGYNTLSFKMKGDWGKQGFAGVFKLKVNGVTYSYKKVGNVWGWYDGETAATNIAMYDAKGEYVEISTLSKVDGCWPWVTFVIMGANQDVEIISDNTNVPSDADIANYVTLYAKDFVWSFGKIEKVILPVEFIPGYDANWSGRGEEDGAIYYQSFTPATIFARYIEDMNTLTFKMKGDWGKQGFAGVFKLKVNGVTYSYKKVGDVWGWYNGEVRATNIAMYDANGDVVEISTLSKVDGSWPWVTFVISGANQDVEIISDNTNVPSDADIANYVTLYAKDFVWSYKK